jgi:hypothetical protein
MSLGFDADYPYVAINDTGSLHTDVRRFNGSTWESIGGGPFPAFNGSFAVTDDRFAFLAFANGSSVDLVQTPPSPWTDEAFISAFIGGGMPPMPAIDIAWGNIVYLGYLSDRDPGPDIVPGVVVSRWNGISVSELPTDGIDPSTVDVIKLKGTRQAGGDVPYVGYVRSNSLVVKKLE